MHETIVFLRIYDCRIILDSSKGKSSCYNNRRRIGQVADFEQ